MDSTSQLRSLLSKEGIIVVPGVFNAFIAKLVEKAGFNAVYLSGAGTSVNLLGFPDIGLMTETEIISSARYIADTVKIPVISDADTGYGNAISVMRTVRDFIRAGVAAIHLEDQVSPKRCGHLEGKLLVSVEEMIGKIRAANKVRKEMDPNFVLIARTDARTAIGGSLEEVVKRGCAYVDAGADVIFPEGPRSVDELEHIARRIDAPLLANIVEGGKTPILGANELEDLGYRIALFPNSILRVIHKTTKEVLEELKKTGTTKGIMEKMLLFPGAFEEVGLKEYRSFEDDFLPREETLRRYGNGTQRS